MAMKDPSSYPPFGFHYTEILDHVDHNYPLAVASEGNAFVAASSSRDLLPVIPFEYHILRAFSCPAGSIDEGEGCEGDINDPALVPPASSSSAMARRSAATSSPPPTQLIPQTQSTPVTWTGSSSPLVVRST